MRTDSVGEIVKNHVVSGIINGKYSIGDKLPPERELSVQTGVSRIVVHTVITELYAKGLLKIVPRRGTFINDYKREGSLELIDLFLTENGVEDNILQDVFAARRMLEREFTSLAAKNRTEGNIEALQGIIKKEEEAQELTDIVAWDFSFHHEIACATGNFLYPLLFKTLEKPYTLLVKMFYQNIKDRATVIAFHKTLLSAIEKRDTALADSTIVEILDHGEMYCRKNR